MTTRSFGLSAIAVMLLGCTGDIGATESSSGPNGAGIGSGVDRNGQRNGSASGALAGTITPLPAGAPELLGLQRLSRRQLENTVTDLFGASAAALVRSEVDYYDNGFVSVGGRQVSVSRSGVDGYNEGAKAIAAAVAQDTTRRGTWMTCTPSGPSDSACLGQFVSSVGRRLFRRSLTLVEQQRFVGVGTTAASAFNDFWKGAEYSLRGLLLSPKFLHLVEIGQQGPLHRVLSDIELASRLSYFLWDTTPDVDLLTLAEKNGLASGLSGTVDRLAANRAKLGQGLDAFLDGWISLYRLDELSKSPDRFPMANRPLFASMKQATLALGEDIALDQRASLVSIFEPGHAYADAALAGFYGRPPGGTGLVKIALDPGGRRTGLLTEPSLLAINARLSETSPTLRGLLVRRLLCMETPAPPANVNTALPERSGGTTKRAQIEAHMKSPSCASCHTQIDPMGFGLENFDALGQERETDNGVTVDASGNLLGTPFNGARELSHAVAARSELAPCIVRRAWTHALGHEPTSSEEGALAPLGDAFQSSGQLLALFTSLAESDSFRTAP